MKIIYPRTSLLGFDLAIGLLLCIATAWIPSLLYKSGTVPASNIHLYAYKKSWLDKVWGGPAIAGTTSPTPQGNWWISTPPRRPLGVRDSVVSAFEQATVPDRSVYEQSVTPPYWSIAASPPSKDLFAAFGADVVGYEVASGWPMIALHGAIVGQPPNEPLHAWCVELPIQSAYTLQSHMIQTGRIIPLRPVLPGAAVNLLVWTLVACCIRHAARFLVSKRRVSQRRCANPTCGYPIAGLQQCPECGLSRTSEPSPKTRSTPDSPSNTC